MEKCLLYSKLNCVFFLLSVQKLFCWQCIMLLLHLNIWGSGCVCVQRESQYEDQSAVYIIEDFKERKGWREHMERNLWIVLCLQLSIPLAYRTGIWGPRIYNVPASSLKLCISTQPSGFWIAAIYLRSFQKGFVFQNMLGHKSARTCF